MIEYNETIEIVRSVLLSTLNFWPFEVSSTLRSRVGFLKRYVFYGERPSNEGSGWGCTYRVSLPPTVFLFYYHLIPTSKRCLFNVSRTHPLHSRRGDTCVQVECVFVTSRDQNGVSYNSWLLCFHPYWPLDFVKIFLGVKVVTTEFSRSNTLDFWVVPKTHLPQVYLHG